MSQDTKEIDFEKHIEDHLLNSGYKKELSKNYDKELCLLPETVLEFIKTTQSEEFEKVKLQYGDDAKNKLLYRLSKEISQRGTLNVLRKGIKDRGAKFKLAYFKPNNDSNPEHKDLYEKNIFTVVRQLKYSQRNENSIDVVIFLNGLPIITAELKNSLTGQFVEDAIKQYKRDRDPKETLLNFKRCFVHFAVGNEKVFMTTRLSKDKTKFLPFNKDTENPVNPDGFKTAYLWEDILKPDSLLEVINSYLHIQKNSEKYFDKTKGLITKTSEAFVFPRFHQLDVVRNLIKEVKQDGVGKKYLIQHSAGSGKSNSIAWLAHQLSSLYQNETDRDRLFHSIIVVTDRKVLDKQLQDTIKQFEQTAGVVNPIDINSAQLKISLESGKDIIITTIQKFPFISKSIADLKGKRFAVLIDEAHSSQSGEATKHLKKSLAVDLEEAEANDNTDDEFNQEDEIIKEIKTRGKQEHISFFAFTATPKNKTLELFGRKNENGKYVAFHIYSMRQAIEEGFILDVLDNYTTFKRYFKLIKSIPSDNKYEKKKALRVLTSYVDLKPHAIKLKINIMLEHFLEKTVMEIQGKARAMIVTRSRLHAVKYFQALNNLMKDKNLSYKPIVAFSGKVLDPDTGVEHTESNLNAFTSRVSIPDAFKTPEYRILVVANKFQTGFDEPLLHTMYVDKKLGGVGAVQTLSRLNRTTHGKNNTVILDFVNDGEDIQLAFQDYYQTSILEEETDPNKLYDLQTELEGYELYDTDDINSLSEIFFNPDKNPETIQPILDSVVDKWKERPEEEKESFRSSLIVYVRLYSFVSQLISFTDIELEKLYVFLAALKRKLPKRKNPLPHEIKNEIDLDYIRVQKIFSGSLSLKKEDSEIPGISSGTKTPSEDEMDLLSMIIKNLNDAHKTDFTEDDKVDLNNIKKKIENHQELRDVMNGDNSLENKKYKFDNIFEDLLLDFVHSKTELYKKLKEPKNNSYLKNKLFEDYRAGI